MTPGSPPLSLTDSVSFVIDALATHRATRLIIEDTITAPLRDYILHTHPPASSKLGYVLTCPYCASVYAALAITATHHKRLRPLRFFVYALAIADVTAILAEKATPTPTTGATGWS